MLHDITWKQFLLATAGTTLLYYLFVAAKYYRDELFALFSKKPPEIPVAAPSQADHPVMGLVAEPDSEMNIVSGDTLTFGPAEAEDEDEVEWPDEDIRTAGADQAKVLLLGGLADFLEDLKTLIRVTLESGDTKENFLVLLELTAERYPALDESRYHAPLIAYLLEAAEELPFELSADELQSALTNASFTK